MLDIRRIESFVTAAEEGHVGRAAARLFVSQPALSRRLRELERDLGFVLFEPSGRGIRLTGEGRGFLVHCRELVAQARQLEARVQGYRSGQQGILRLGASPQMLERVIADLLPRYARSFPEVEVELSEGHSQEHRQRLLSGEIDLALIPAPADPHIAGRPLPTLTVLAAVPGAQRTNWPNHVDIESLSGVAVLLLHEGYVSRQAFDTACRVARVTPHVVLESGAPQTVLALAEAGLGIAIIPSTVSLHDRELHVVPATHRGTALTIPVSVCWSQRRYIAPYMEAFVDELIEVAKAALPSFAPAAGK